MKNRVGIVAEYNPFHFGHQYQIDEIRKAIPDAEIVVIMSGNFTQRGEMAIASKWDRAKWAVEGGANLVVELPTIHATSYASDFGKCGVSILEALGCQYISFGSELEMDQLEKCIEAGEMPEHSPNAILAIEYIKAMTKAKPLLIKRVGEGYNSTELGDFSSAKAIRLALSESGNIKGLVPSFVEADITRLPSKGLLFDLIRYMALDMKVEDIENIASSDNGLGSRLKEKAMEAKDYDELVEMLSSKKHSKARINRFLIQLLLGITRDMQSIEPKVTQVLTFDQIGQKIIGENRGGEIKLVNKLKRDMHLEEDDQTSLNMDIHGSDIYNLLLNSDIRADRDYFKKSNY
ncbi:MAG: nucleotidyltransferase family protein [Clostridia bacterium]|nr:nucleotidyltransferase family protein [Clostridia bacterium]